MTIRMLAEELYRIIKEVEALEKALRKASLSERAAIEDQLRKAKAEERRLRGILDDKKRSR
jgi:ABC-type phosphate transport system auxiliary subunit